MNLFLANESPRCPGAYRILRQERRQGREFSTADTCCETQALQTRVCSYLSTQGIQSTVPPQRENSDVVDVRSSGFETLHLGHEIAHQFVNRS
jgi:hypothetical protein